MILVRYCPDCERPVQVAVMRRRGWREAARGWTCPDCLPDAAPKPAPLGPLDLAAELGLRAEPYPGGAWCPSERDALTLATKLRQRLGPAWQVARTSGIVVARIKGWAA